MPEDLLATKKEKVIPLVKQIYHDTFVADLQTSARETYQNGLIELETLIPVIDHPQSLSITPTTLPPHVLIAANHIQTPELFAIRDETFLETLETSTQEFHFSALHPNIVRYFPLLNPLIRNGYQTSIISQAHNNTLVKIHQKWNHVLIPQTAPKGSRLTTISSALEDKIKTSDKNAFVIFPEGRDVGVEFENFHYWTVPYKKGAILIARSLGIPILPISLIFDPFECKYMRNIHPLLDVSSITDSEIGYFTTILQDTIENGMRSCDPRVYITQLQEKPVYPRN